MSNPAIREQWHRAHAESQAIACWLNCYLREFALPKGWASLVHGDRGLPATLARSGGPVLRLRVGSTGWLCIRVARTSLLGRCEFTSAPFVKTDGQPWRCADVAMTVRFLLDGLGLQEPSQGELYRQALNSVEVCRHLLAHAGEPAVEADPLLEAEQGMLWGHALHPTPKSREGLPMPSVIEASPEARACFALHWFAVDPRLLRCRGSDVRPTLERLSGAPDRYPCHPWEVARVLAHPLMRKAIAEGLVRPLGPLGWPVFATSSVRTVYHPQLDYFLKLSVHVRLTNCVRKNAWYELESAVALTQLLQPARRDIARRCSGFGVMPEPAATTLDFDGLGGDAGAGLELVESFGVLYRESFAPAERECWQPRVAGALFAVDAQGRSVCRRLLRREGIDKPADIVRWFEAYAWLLLEGTWLAYFEHGIVLEPHLQNTLVGLRQGMPVRVWVRDLEGTKLVDRLWAPDRLAGLSDAARASVLYTAEQGWRRVIYCAVVNNLAEAMFHLAEDDPALEPRMWQAIAHIVQRWQTRHGRHRLLDELLGGAGLPAKNNLRTRLFQRADRDADYTPLPNPLVGASAPWAAA